MAIGSILRFEFDVPISRGTGSIAVARYANGTGIVEEFTTGSAKSGISGNVLMLRTTPSLYARNTLYYVIFRPGAVQDEEGNSFGGLVNGAVYSFKTFAGNSDARFLYDYSAGLYTIDFYNKDDAAKNGLLSADYSKLFLQGTNTSITGTKTYVAQANLINSNGILALNSAFGTTLDKAVDQGVSEDVLDGSSNEQQFLGAAIDRQERLVLAGKVSSAGADSKGYFVTRFDKFGRIDKTFQPSLFGKRQYDLTDGPDVAWSVIIQQKDNDVANDRYVIGGTVNSGNSVGLFRLMNNGDPDSTFGTPQSWIQVSKGIQLIDQSLYNSSSFAFAKPPSKTTIGDLLITGSGLENGQRVFRTYSYSADGLLNMGTFGNSTGQAITNFNPYSSDRATAAMNYCIKVPDPCSQVAGANENRTLVGGTVIGTNSSRWALVRLDESGTIDTDWGNNGNDFQVLNEFDQSKAVTFVDFGVQEDGKVVVLGYVTETVSGRQVIYPKLERYNRDGTLDSTFGSSGNLLLKSSNNVTPYKLSLSPDHLFVTATATTGTRGTDFAVFVRDKDGQDLYGWGSDAPPPSVTAMTPASGAANVSAGTNITITYSGAVQRGSGAIELRQGSASGAILETLQVSDSGNVSISNTSLILNPDSDLPSGTKVFVIVSSGAVLDTNGAPAATPVNYFFTTASQNNGGEPTSISSTAPASGAGNVPPSTNISVVYSGAVQRGSGTIEIRNGSATGTILESLRVSDTGKVSFSNRSLILNPAAALPLATKVFIRIPAGAVLDLYGRSAATPTNYSFTTASSVGDTSRPTVKGYSFGKSALIFTFSENIKRGSGSLTLYQLDASSRPVGGAVAFTASISGKVLTIKPKTALASGKKYKFTFLPKAITDLAGNDLLPPTYISSSYTAPIF